MKSLNDIKKTLITESSASTPELANSPKFYDKVAKELAKELGSNKIKVTNFESDNYSRQIEFTEYLKGKPVMKYTISHDWDKDGSATKPVTEIDVTVLDNTYESPDVEETKKVGRISIWKEPNSYAEDIGEMIGDIIN